MGDGDALWNDAETTVLAGLGGGGVCTTRLVMGKGTEGPVCRGLPGTGQQTAQPMGSWDQRCQREGRPADNCLAPTCVKVEHECDRHPVRAATEGPKRQ